MDTLKLDCLVIVAQWLLTMTYTIKYRGVR